MKDLDKIFEKLVKESYKDKKVASINNIATKSFIDYGASVILGRAIPDLRDGLKPSHRRLLYAMKELGISSTSAHKKSARITGTTIGLYHPHGDMAAYETLVSMAQPWKNNQTFVDGQGNWGSIDGDSPASQRYCLTSNALLKTPGGSLYRIGGMLNTDSKTKKEKDIDLNILGFRGKEERAIKHFNSGKHEIYSMESELGYEVAGSINHPILVVSDNFPFFKWKELPEIAIGDYVIIDRTQSIDKTTSLEAWEQELDQNLKAIICGLILNQDTSVTNNKILYKTQLKSLLNFFVNYIKKITPLLRNIEFNTYQEGDFYFCSIKNNNIELKNILEIKNSRVGVIPDFVLSGQRDTQKAFLRAIFNSAQIVNTKIILKNSNQNLLKDIQIMLLNFGIISKRQKNSLCILNLNIFKGKIGFLKPIQSELFEENLSDFEEKFPSGIESYLTKIFKKEISTYDNLKLALEEPNLINSNDLLFCEDLLRNNYFFDKVISVSKSLKKENVYSIKVDSEDHSFVANGLINHNTEARLTKSGELLFRDLDKNVVDFMPNYDGTEKEPSVLPAPYPAILINGTPAGSIAVGMATSMLPHNPTEVLNALIKIVEYRKEGKDITAEEILNLIPAPDFPTGGIVYNTSSMLDIIKTGKGSVRLRAKHVIEKNKQKSLIVITEIPFSKKKSTLIDEIVSLKKNEKENHLLSGISNIIDESAKDIRVVIEVKSGFDPEAIWNYILKKTDLDTSLAYFCIVIDTVKENGITKFMPKEYGILDILNRYLDFRIELLIRKWEYILDNSQKRLHILEGLLKALDMINEVIAIAKESKQVDIARERLQKELGFSEEQSIAILSLRISKLTGMERKVLENEKKDLEKTIKESRKILNNSLYQKDLLIEDFTSLIGVIGTERLTEIKDIKENIIVITAPKEEVSIVFTEKGYLKRIPEKTLKKSKLSGDIESLIELTEGDSINKIIECSSLDTIFIICENGQVFGIKACDISDNDRGIFSGNLFDISSKILAILNHNDNELNKNFVMVTSDGNIKQTALSDFSGALRKPGVSGITLKDNKVISVYICEGNEDILMVTKNAKTIRFNLSEVPVTGRSSQGVRGMKIKEGDSLLDTCLLNNSTSLSIITENGIEKDFVESEFKVQSRAGVGVLCMTLTKKSGLISKLVIRE